MCAVADKILVCCYLSCGRTVIGVSGTIIYQPEICQSSGGTILFNSPDPSPEDISFTGGSCGDVNCFVDLDIVILRNKTAIVVVVPVDVGPDFLVLFDIDSLEQNSVVILFCAVKFRRSNSAAVLIGYLGVRRKHIECGSGEHVNAGRHVFASIPVLDLPVAENILVRIAGSNCGLCKSLCPVHVVVVVDRCAGSAVQVVLDLDAVSSDQFAAPLGVKIEFSYGCGILRIDLRCSVQLTVGGDVCLVDPDSFEVECVCEFGIRVPADEVKVDTLSAQITDVVSLVSIELSGLLGIIVLDRVGCAVIGVNVDLIFVETPLGVKCYVVCGHLVECERFTCAERVVIPAKENKSIIFGSLVICGS